MPDEDTAGTTGAAEPADNPQTAAPDTGAPDTGAPETAPEEVPAAAAQPGTDGAQVTGSVTMEVRGPDGALKSRQVVENLITDAGDQYHARCIAAGVAPASAAAPPRVTGIKLGTGTTAAAKSGAGAALVTYLAGSNRIFDAGTPTTENVGAGLGWTVTYAASWPAGAATHTALTEMGLVTDAATDATTTAANTISRLVYAASPKGANDTLTVTWAIKQLGL